MSEAARVLTVTTDDARFMRFESGRCVALQARGEQIACSIYDMRPDACRWLVPGSSTCLEMLSTKQASGTGRSGVISIKKQEPGNRRR